MGSVVSRPKVTAVTTTTSSSSADAAGVADTTTTEPDAAEVEKERAENVLRRSRGALGTVLTSFRGILKPNQSDVQRKSLLGE